MKCFIVLFLATCSLAQQTNPQREEQEQSYNPGPYESYHTPANQGYGQEQPAFQPVQNRNGITARTGFFDISGSYATSLVGTFLFVIGFILAIEFVLGDLNIIKTITGRSARNLFEDGSELFSAVSPQQLVDTADEVYSAIERYQNRNLPRSF